MNDSDSSTQLGAVDPASLLEVYLGRRDEGDTSSAEDLIDRAGDDADALRSRLALLGELEQLSLLLSEDQGSVPDDLEQLGRFESLHMIGQGGLSKVFFAHDPRLGRDVALKVLSPASLDSDVRDLLLSEGRSLAGLEHDSIVRVYEIDEAEGFAYIAMERIVGPSLHETLEVMRALRAGADETEFDPRAVTAARQLDSFPARCRLVAKLARALEYCHDKGTVHRDIKPGNILIDASGTPKLIDFGLAHLESDDEISIGLTQKLVGTPAYITPEQVDQKRTGVSPRSDQFSLGIVLYELLTLVNPFNRQTREDTLTAISKANPPPLRTFAGEIPIDVERTCLHCLERAPTERYAQIGELAADLEAFLDYRAISIQAPSPMRLAQLWLRRNRDKVRTAVLVSAALITVLGVIWIGRARTHRNEFATRLRAAVERVPELANSDEVYRALETLRDLRQEAARYDAAMLSGSVLPAVGDGVQELADLTSLRLNELAEVDFGAARTASPRERKTMSLTAGLIWKESLRFDHKVNPTSEINRHYRMAGTVALPVGGFLRVLDRRSPIQTFQDAERDGYLEPGFYRFTTEEAGRIREAEFYLRLWEEQANRTPAPLAEGLRTAMVRCEGGIWRFLDRAANKPLEYHQEPFLVLPRLVTWADVNAIFGTDWVSNRHRQMARHDLPPTRFASDAPASMSPEKAIEYCLRVGARLPTLPELVAAHSRRLIEPSAETIRYELTSSFTEGGEMRGKVHGASLLEALASGDPLEPAQFLFDLPDDALNKDGFRVVLSASMRASGFR